MSDYPRPVPPSPSRPYGPDRIVALAFAALVLLASALWFMELFRRPDAGSRLDHWWGYYVSCLSALLVYGLIFRGVSQSRRWAFVTALPFTGFSIATSVVAGNAVRALAAFALFGYCTVRLFGLFGPRPLRRNDVL